MTSPMSRLFRRFSLRRKNRPSPGNIDKATARSWPHLPDLHFHPLSSGSTATLNSPIPSLPDAIIVKCLEKIDDPFQLAQLRSVNRTFRDYVDQRFNSVMEMDVRRMPSNTFLCDSSWKIHPFGLKMGMRQSRERIEIVVEEDWTSKEVIALCGVLNVFRRNVRRIWLDAPIIELIIASLSLLDLDRWYAFQCFIQAINEQNVRIRFMPEKTSHGLYWPEAQTIIIRTTEKDSNHLARVLDYGVRSQLVMDRRRLDELRIVLTDVDDVDHLDRALNRNLYHFRCWAGSAGFDDRFHQQYSVNVA